VTAVLEKQIQKECDLRNRALLAFVSDCLASRRGSVRGRPWKMCQPWRVGTIEFCLATHGTLDLNRRFLRNEAAPWTRHSRDAFCFDRRRRYANLFSELNSDSFVSFGDASILLKCAKLSVTSHEVNFKVYHPGDPTDM
jgi:hypothetical protein